jgi:hypothetical protein
VLPAAVHELSAGDVITTWGISVLTTRVSVATPRASVQLTVIVFDPGAIAT